MEPATNQFASAAHGPRRPSRGTLLIISQVYVPDPASVGQHVADAAAEMVRRGYDVVVLAARRGYDDPSKKYPKRELIDGVDVRRLPFASLGKKHMAVRFLAGILFTVQCALRGLFMPRLSAVLVSTSPPMSPFAAIFISLFRRAPIKFWAMDLNIDLLVAMGRAKPTSPLIRLFAWMDRTILRRADEVIALDVMMAERLNAKFPAQHKMSVIPPWPHEDHLESIPHAENPFRRQHGLEDKFVIMFSGNLTVAANVDTILDAALKLTDQPRLLFMFIGGGSGKKIVDEFIRTHQPPNVVSLPYQPLSQIKYSLSAADVHLVSVGDMLPGLSHPCKIYGAMTVGRPVLLLGPPRCHVADIISEEKIGWQVRHGDVDGAIETVKRILHTDPHQLKEMGERARAAVQRRFSMRLLCGQFCDILERDLSNQPTSERAAYDQAKTNRI